MNLKSLAILVVLVIVAFVEGFALLNSLVRHNAAIARPTPEIDGRIIPFDGRKDSVWNMWNGLIIIRQKGSSAPEIDIDMREYHDSIIVKDGERVLFEWKRGQ